MCIHKYLGHTKKSGLPSGFTICTTEISGFGGNFERLKLSAISLEGSRLPNIEYHIVFLVMSTPDSCRPWLVICRSSPNSSTWLLKWYLPQINNSLGLLIRAWHYYGIINHHHDSSWTIIINHLKTIDYPYIDHRLSIDHSMSNSPHFSEAASSILEKQGQLPMADPKVATWVRTDVSSGDDEEIHHVL